MTDTSSSESGGGEQPPEEARDYSADSMALLTDWLHVRDWTPSEGLLQIFAEAGHLLPYRRTRRLEITTRLLFFAITRLDTELEPGPESALLRKAGKFLGRNREVQKKVENEYFLPAPGRTSSPLPAPALSPNVGRLLEAAIADAGSQVGRANILTPADLLAVFPRPGTNADELMKMLEIDPTELHEIARAKNERVSTHADEPADFDELGRQAFADILADRIREARDSGVSDEPSAFIVHLHGPWGSGKSSVLNFLEANLSQPPEPWIVVRFNAWRDQRLQPPWWRLITTIYSGARSKLGWRAALLWGRWLIWRIRADYVPMIAVALFTALLFILLFWAGSAVPIKDAASTSTPSRPWLDILIRLAPVVITVVGAIYFGSRALALGSRRAAQAYAELKDDPYKPIAGLFNNLVTAIKEPLVVFIDDLDRCDSKYVVELLEGIQTLMRGAAVTYVVAADRKWICSSFEQRYTGFSSTIGESGRPLGYLFLDKLFQISAAIPQIPADVRTNYWARLLSSEQVDPAEQVDARKREREEADQAAAGLSRQEDLQQLVDAAEKSGDAIRIQAVRAACAKQITSPKAAVRTEHRLQVFSELLEPNPRSMKRLVNAYAMHQATLLLAGLDAAPGPLARWTILELRWPLLADFLAMRPDCVDSLSSAIADGEPPHVPSGLRSLFGDLHVADVVGDSTLSDRLTTDAVKKILGAVQGDR